MKVYNLNIDTSKPTNQVVQMQQGATGLLNANVTNDGKYIRNLSCTIYDGANEISATTSADNSFGFKVDVGTEPKHVKVVAKSTPVECSAQYIVSVSGAHRAKQVALNILQLEAGVYNQSEFYGIAKRFGNGYVRPHASQLSNVNFDIVWFIANNTAQPVWFGKIINNKYVWFNADEPIVVSDYTDIVNMKQVMGTNVTLSSETYPAIGYYTDYQMDTLIKPSDNAPYDGNYVEPLEEIEVDGVKFVPTTLSVDGVEYKVLAEAQPTSEPETNDGE